MNRTLFVISTWSFALWMAALIIVSLVRKRRERRERDQFSARVESITR